MVTVVDSYERIDQRIGFDAVSFADIEAANKVKCHNGGLVIIKVIRFRKSPRVTKSLGAMSNSFFMVGADKESRDNMASVIKKCLVDLDPVEMVTFSLTNDANFPNVVEGYGVGLSTGDKSSSSVGLEVDSGIEVRDGCLCEN